VNNATSELARSITKAGSKQAFYTGRLVIDRDLVDDYYRAYAYFRWADDIIDSPAYTKEERIAFVKRQKELIDDLYNGARPTGLTSEEEILADLIHHDRGERSGLQSFIRNMFAIIEFDAYRKGGSIDQEELDWYSECLARSVTDGMQYFIGNGRSYPDGTNRYSAARGAHIAHLLRDTILDTSDGFVNVPDAYLETYKINAEDVESEPYRSWVQRRVKEARNYLSEGKRYLDALDVLRCKLAGFWYCARFEAVLDTIEHDDYHLRLEYKERQKLSTWFKISWLAVQITLRHITRRGRHRQDSLEEV